MNLSRMAFNGILIVAICLAGICALLRDMFFVLIDYGTSPGPFDRSKMESLVRQVRTQQFACEKDFYWKEVSGVAKLDVDERQFPIFAKRDEQGRLTVVITNGGGRGATGFAYSDAPFIRSKSEYEAPPGGCWLDLPGYLHAAFPKKQIDAHWWPVWENQG